MISDIATYNTRTYTIPARSVLNLDITGSAIKHLNGTGDLSIQFDDKQITDFGRGIGYPHKVNSGFQKVSLVNNNSFDVEGEIFYGTGDIDNSSLTLNGAIQTKGAAARRGGAVSVGISPVEVIAANNDRTGWLIFNTSDTTIYIGNDNTVSTSTGYPVQPSGQIGWDDLDAVYAVAESGASTIRYMEVTN